MTELLTFLVYTQGMNFLAHPPLPATWGKSSVLSSRRTSDSRTMLTSSGICLQFVAEQEVFTQGFNRVTLEKL